VLSGVARSAEKEGQGAAAEHLVLSRSVNNNTTFSEVGNKARDWRSGFLARERDPISQSYKLNAIRNPKSKRNREMKNTCQER
jgi:hypothetical protein